MPSPATLSGAVVGVCVVVVGGGGAPVLTVLERRRSARLGRPLVTADDFAYTDPTNGEVTPRQGLRFVFSDGSRVIFRLSGTGSSGATVRVYIDSYTNDPALLALPAAAALAPLVAVALDMSNLTAFLARDAPTVIT